MVELERIPAKEAERIGDVVEPDAEAAGATIHGQEKPVRRGVHPKDHGCVTAKFRVLESLPQELQVGLFSRPGHEFDALIRFSNADANPEKAELWVAASEARVAVHGSRGMAVKLRGVTRKSAVTTNLMTTHGRLMQDFLMINQPVFRVCECRGLSDALSEVLLAAKDDVAERLWFSRLAQRTWSGRSKLACCRTEQSSDDRGRHMSSGFSTPAE